MNPRLPWLFVGPLLFALPLGALGAEDKGCVWRLQGPKAAVYLAGSIHLLRESDHPLPAAYEKAYDDCSCVYFEVDLESMTTREGQATAAKLGALPPGEKLEDWLTEATMRDLRAYLERRNLPRAQMERLRPGILTLTITNLESMRLGAMAQFGVEAIFDGKARAAGKEIRALETLEFQLGLFNELKREEQDRMLRITLDDIEEAPQRLATMIEAWRAGDGVKLVEELNRNFEEEDAGLLKRLLYDRNANWIPAIEAALNREDGANTLFIVGAGHLVGEQSVIELLEKKGYRPQPWAPAVQ